MERVRKLPVFLTLALAAALAGCPADPDPTPTPTPTPVPEVASVEVSGNHAVQIGATLALTASTDGGSDAAYTWTSSNTSIATVDGGGTVTGVAAGEATITATGADTGASGEHAVVVTALPVTFDPVVVVTGAFYVANGATAQLEADTVNGDDASYTWTVDDEDVATVDASGLLTAHFPGSVTVTATGADSGLSGTLGIVVADVIPHLDEWMGSAHADTHAEAFRHWDADGAVPTSCARCHSTPGYRDYIGADGSAAGSVEAAAPIGSTVECEACHNSVASHLDSVTFPSGETVADLGPEARCMTCHQGRASGDSVETAITNAAVASDDEISASLNFINIHYYAAGATIMAGLARGGYQYEGETYDVRFRHVDEPNACAECHNPHSLEVNVEVCSTCHEGVAAVDDLKDVRMMASASVDYDGDGDLDEGIYYELQGMRERLMTAMQAYATAQGSSICWDEHAYPYFFIDTNADGSCDAAEAVNANKYVSFTARLLRGAYNYQVASKDPGAFAHNAKYIIELLYDSTMDLNNALSSPADLSAMRRNDPGHFNGSGEPARHWDEDEEISASCSKCHGASEGFRFFVEYGVGLEVLEQGNGLDCETCHETFGDVADPADAYAILDVGSFRTQDGVAHDFGDAASNLCSTCHSGRKTKADVDATIASGSPRFQNVHYLPAGGVRLGSDGHVGYEYGMNAYSGPPTGHLAGDTCETCHAPDTTGHSFLPGDAYAAGDCAPCHNAAGSPDGIRGTSRNGVDYDGDGNATEPSHAELETMAAAVLAKLHADYGLCYDSHTNPYFFVGGDATGACLAGEANSGNRFTAFDAASVKATYNYQLWSKDPGAWAHNFDYVGQLLYDAYDDLGGDPATAGWVRPTP